MAKSWDFVAGARHAFRAPTVIRSEAALPSVRRPWAPTPACGRRHVPLERYAGLRNPEHAPATPDRAGDVAGEYKDITPLPTCSTSGSPRAHRGISDELQAIKAEFSNLNTNDSELPGNRTGTPPELDTEDSITPTDIVTSVKTAATSRASRCPTTVAKRGDAQAGHGDEGKRLDRPVVHRRHTTTCCASRTVAARTGSRSGKCRKARNSHVANPSSICSRG